MCAPVFSGAHFFCDARHPRPHTLLAQIAFENIQKVKTRPLRRLPLQMGGANGLRKRGRKWGRKWTADLPSVAYIAALARLPLQACPFLYALPACPAPSSVRPACPAHTPVSVRLPASTACLHCPPACTARLPALPACPLPCPRLPRSRHRSATSQGQTLHAPLGPVDPETPPRCFLYKILP